VAILESQRQPAIGLDTVLRDALPGGVKRSQFALCLGICLLRRQAQQDQSLVAVLRHALTVNVHIREAHLRVGRLLAAHTPAERRQEAIFDIVNQLNRGAALHALGRHREAMESYARALALAPERSGIHSNIIFVLDFIPEISFVEHQRERHAYGQSMAAIPTGAPHGNDRDPSRPLVLGYVSGDFKHHSAAACFRPVLRRHDRARFRIACYSGARDEDDWTQEFRELADVWRPISGVDDAVLDEQIRADRVDILIDLSGHTTGNRMPLFARKPAPIQVTAWGHGGGINFGSLAFSEAMKRWFCCASWAACFAAALNAWEPRVGQPEGVA